MDVAFLSGKNFNDQSSCYHLTVASLWCLRLSGWEKVGSWERASFSGCKTINFWGWAGSNDWKFSMASSCDSSEEDLAKFAVITDVVDSGMMKKLIYLQEEMEFCLLIRLWSFFQKWRWYIALLHLIPSPNQVWGQFYRWYICKLLELVDLFFL